MQLFPWHLLLLCFTGQSPFACDAKWQAPACVGEYHPMVSASVTICLFHSSQGLVFMMTVKVYSANPLHRKSHLILTLTLWGGC